MLSRGGGLKQIAGSTAVMFFGFLFGAIPAGEAAPSLPQWSTDFLADPAGWPIRMNDAAVSKNGRGMKVAIAPGKTWAVAAIPGVLLPADAAEARVRIARISRRARWFIKLIGDFDRSGQPDTLLPFGATGETGRCLDPA